VLTGDFIAGPVPGGRELLGYPGFAALPEKTRILFIGSESELARYRTALGAAPVRFLATDERVGNAVVAEILR
jgi:hypothetical protein